MHISKGKPNVNSTKIWLTKNGGCIVANNNSNIPNSELGYLIEIISAQYFVLVSKWKEHFCIEDVRFYC